MSRSFGIPLRNGLPLGLGTVATLRSGGASWTPLSLFLAGEQGGWYDPTDLTTMFQDSAGTTPVTAVEQPVGLWLDKRLGALSALGVELSAYAAGFASTAGISGIGATVSVASGVLTATATSADGADRAEIPISGLTVGSRYRVEIVAARGAQGSQQTIRASTALDIPNTAITTTAQTTYRFIVAATATSGVIRVYAQDAAGAVGDSVLVSSISVREVPGNHLIQPTSASRPTYSKRYNQAVSTEDLTTASWTASGLLSRTLTGSATLPNGAVVPLTRCVENTANAAHRVQNTGNYTLTSGQEYVVSAVVKKGSRTWHYLRFDDASSSFLWFNADTGATGTVSAGLTSPSVVSLGDGAWLVSARRVTNAAAVQVLIGYGTADNSATFTGDGASFFDAGGVDLRRTIHTTMGMPAYQRVTTATDYDEVGFLPRVRVLGGDDGMYTAASVDFSSTDEMTVLAGMSKLADPAGGGTIVELTATSASNNGAFTLLAPDPSATNFIMYSRGTTRVWAQSSSIPAPVNGVITGLAKISAPSISLRRNGSEIGSQTGSQGTGNYSNAVLYVGRRNNASLPGEFDIFQLIIRGALTSGADLTSAEQYVAQRTGVTL